MYVATPLIPSTYLGNDVYLKLENTQPTGSFKSRGMTALVNSSLTNNANAHFYSSSGGNAGLGVAEAAFRAGRPCSVVVPEKTSDFTVARLERYGAKVIRFGESWYFADQKVKELMSKDTNAVYCHPFDNPIIWEGHSTLVDELVFQTPEKPAAIVVAAGGGGLYLGVMVGLERNGWTDVPVYVVETENASCFRQTLEAGKVILTDPPTSVASSLGSRYIPEKALELAQKYNSRSVLVTDREALDAVDSFASDHRFLVEPACGAALAAVYRNKVVASGPIVVVVCGGSTWGIGEIVSSRISA